LVDAQSKRVNINSNVYVGTMGWSYAFWKGVFYPADLAAKDFLTYYATWFRTVEVDNTFYRIPSEQTVLGWKNQTPSDFVFSLKFPQWITHIKMLQDCAEETALFLERVDLLGEKLGVLLLQLPSMFRQTHFPLLREYLKTLPQHRRYVVEIRNKSLFTPDLYSLLREHKVALAWADAPNMLLPEEVTSDFLYLRWVGDRKNVTGTLSRTEIDQTTSTQTWVTKLKNHLKKQTPIFGYFSKYYSGYPPKDVEDFVKFARVLE
jgi:uncharacterized protein YecE (DUF72 family)